MPFVVLIVGAAYSFSGGGEGERLVLAQGASGGSFHPIAGDFEPDATRLESCAGDFRCLEQAFGNIAYRQGPRVALAIFDERMSADENVQRDCHRIAHVLGSAALARFDGDIALTFSRGSPSCASGYYHGILERAFVGVASKKSLARIARTLCEGAGTRRFGFLDYQCRHGLGHGLMIQSGYDLPLTLSMCAGLETGWDEVSCTGGAFMENTNTSFGFRSAWLDDDDPVYPCNHVANRHRRSCYTRVTTRVLDLNGTDWAATASTCHEVASEWRGYCFRSYGRDAAGAVRHVPSKIIPLCRLAELGESDCLYGAARSVADTYLTLDPATELCARAGRAHRDACFSGLGVVVGLRNATSRARHAVCVGLTRRHVGACADSANAEVHPSGRWAWG